MVDRETVLTWLEICGENDDCSGCCPYGDEGETFNCRSKLMADALALLKEQEAVAPVMVPHSRGFAWNCGECGTEIAVVRDTVSADAIPKMYRYCRMCGVRIKWG